MNGKAAVVQGRLVGEDEEEIRDNANRIAAKLYAKAGVAGWS